MNMSVCVNIVSKAAEKIMRPDFKANIHFIMGAIIC